MTRDDWELVESVLHKPDVRIAMRGRCEEQGHEYENGISLFMRSSHTCKWCGDSKPGLYP